MRGLLLPLALCGVGLTGCWAGVREEAVCEHAKLNTQDATPVDPGTWELDIASALTTSHRTFANDWGVERRPHLRQKDLGLSLTYGLAEDLNVGLGLGRVSVHDRDSDDRTVHGCTDLELSAKWRFYNDEARRLEIAYVPAITLPTGSNGITDDFVSVFNGVAVSKDWTNRWTSNFDLGYSCPIGGRREGYRGTLSADAALGYHVTDCLQPEVELNYAHDFAHGSDGDLVAATVGVIMCISDGVRLSVGVQQGLAGRNADKGTTLTAGLALTF